MSCRRSIYSNLAKRTVGTLPILALSAILQAPAYGQSGTDMEAGSAAATEGSSQGATQLTPITVTETDIAARTSTVYDGDELKDRGITDIESVLRATPGVNINSSGGTNLSTIYVRGVGSMYPMNLDDSAVTMIVDGSPLSARHLPLGTLDLESIEVAKGPQTTRSGALGLAGAINIATKKPTRYLEGYVRGEYGSDEQHLLEGAVGGPISNVLSGRIAMRYSGAEHWVTNKRDGEPLSDPQEMAIRGSLLWDVTDRTSGLLTVEHQEVDQHPSLFVLKPFTDDPGVDLTPGLYDDITKAVNRFALRVDHTLSASQISSMTSYTDSSSTEIVAYGRDLYTSLYGFPSEFWNQDEAQEGVFNQDIVWSSLPDTPWSWLAGVAMEYGDRSYDTPLNTFGRSSATYRDFKTERYSLYGEVSYPIAEKVRVTGGLRQTWNSNDYDAEFHSSGNVSYDSRSVSDSFTTGRFELAYDLAPDTELYASLSRGKTPGGFNIYASQVADGEPYEGATNDSIEVGFDLESADRRISLKGATYFSRVKDNHLLSYNSTTFVVSALNADTRSMGAELQGSWQASENLALSANVSYVDTEITTDVLGIGDGDVLSGNKVPDVSPWSASFSVTYSHEMPQIGSFVDPLFYAGLNYQYVGERAADPQNHFDLDSYHKVDLRTGITLGASEIYLRADNILDERYELYGYYASASATSYGAPVRGRTFIAGVSYRF